MKKKAGNFSNLKKERVMSVMKDTYPKESDYTGAKFYY